MGFQVQGYLGNHQRHCRRKQMRREDWELGFGNSDESRQEGCLHLRRCWGPDRGGVSQTSNWSPLQDLEYFRTNEPQPRDANSEVD